MVRWFRERPRVTDALLALAVLALGLPSTEANLAEYRSLDAWAAVLLLAVTGLLVLRRERPVVVWSGVTALAVAYVVVGYNPSPVGLAVLVCLYTVASRCPRSWSVAVLAITLVLVFIGLVLDPQVRDDELPIVVANSVVFVTAWVIGDNLQTRRKYVAELEQRAARLEQERAAEAARAVARERERIARELHDVVAHHVSLMVVQAGAARRVLGSAPDRAEAALEVVETTGRQAMGEMRAMLGVLRPESADAHRVPQPGVAGLDALLEQVRAAGVELHFSVAGDPRPLSPGIDLAVYRIVQEALTNVVKHADASHAHVCLSYLPDAVKVDVADDGRGAVLNNGVGTSGQHGLIGMRERVGLYGGTIDTGPRRGGGFRVRASIPTPEHA